MDIAVNMEFWSDVGMTVAARLSMIALILWMTKNMIDARLGERLTTAPAVVNRFTEAPITKPVAETKPKVVTLRRPDGEKATVSGNRERMRTQLLAYLEERTAERGN